MKKNVIKDFNVQSLPSNRKEQFFDLLKHRFFLFFSLGSLLLLFSLPFLGALLTRDIFLVMAHNDSSINNEEKFKIINTIQFYYSLSRIISFLIIALGLGGILGIYKQLIYDEPLFFKEDFFYSLKENWKQYVIYGLFAAIFCFFADFLAFLISIDYLKYIFKALNAVFLLPILFVALFVSNNYQNSLIKSISTSLLIYLKAFPSIFLSFILIYAISFLSYIPFLFLKYALLLSIFLLVLPILLLGAYENVTSLFDSLINREQFPDYYLKGLSTFYSSKREN